MKILSLLMFALITSFWCDAQILKKLGKELESDARWKVRMKANQKMDQALDTVLAQPKKIINKKDKSSENKSAADQQQKGEGMNASVNSTNNDESQGYVTLALSAYEVFKNGIVTITGNSIKYGNFNNVQLNITGPSGKQNLTAPLNESNAYSKDFMPTLAGDYVITAVSSNNKTKQTAKLKVSELGMMDWQENIQVVDKALDRLKTEVNRAEQSISSKDKAQLDKKVDELEEQAKLAKKLFTDLNEGMKQLKGMEISEQLGKHLSELNNTLTDQRVKMEQVNDIKHEPYDNTICEYLVMVNEACAAFQTFTNFYTKTIKGVLKNILIDKVVPAGVGAVNDAAVNASSTKEGAAKVFLKYAANASLDAESLESKLGKAGMGADVAQFIIDVLLKSYCGLFSGEITENYTEIFRNNSNVIWWKYNYETKAAITFRYPKSQTGKVIKMKGNIEGNATKFSIFQDPEQNDEFEKARGKTKLMPFLIQAPVAVPFATSQYDKLGFGAVARCIATPAYFNIPVDAEYNIEDNTIKLMINDAIADFLPTVTYKYAYIAIAAGIPLFTVIDYRINKAKATLNAVVSKNSELQVIKDAKNNLTVKGGGSRKIGEDNSSNQHIITYTLTAKKDN